MIVLDSIGSLGTLLIGLSPIAAVFGIAALIVLLYLLIRFIIARIVRRK